MNESAEAVCFFGYLVLYVSTVYGAQAEQTTVVEGTKWVSFAFLIGINANPALLVLSAIGYAVRSLSSFLSQRAFL